MLDLDSVIANSFGALSVLLVFSTLIFSIRYPEILKDIEHVFSIGKKQALSREKKTLMNNLIFKWFPVVIITFICAYVMMPLGIKILKTSYLNVFDFDMLRTTFVLVWYFSILLFSSTIYLGIRLFCKIKNEKD